MKITLKTIVLASLIVFILVIIFSNFTTYEGLDIPSSEMSEEEEDKKNEPTENYEGKYDDEEEDEITENYEGTDYNDEDEDEITENYQEGKDEAEEEEVKKNNVPSYGSIPSKADMEYGIAGEGNMASS